MSSDGKAGTPTLTLLALLWPPVKLGASRLSPLPNDPFVSRNQEASEALQRRNSRLCFPLQPSFPFMVNTGVETTSSVYHLLPIVLARLALFVRGSGGDQCLYMVTIHCVKPLTFDS